MLARQFPTLIACPYRKSPVREVSVGQASKANERIREYSFEYLR